MWTEVDSSAFLTDPTVPVDASCADPVVFDTPFLATATNADGTASISIDLAAGFHEQVPWGSGGGNASGIAVASPCFLLALHQHMVIVEKYVRNLANRRVDGGRRDTPLLYNLPRPCRWTSRYRVYPLCSMRGCLRQMTPRITS